MRRTPLATIALALLLATAGCTAAIGQTNDAPEPTASPADGAADVVDPAAAGGGSNPTIEVATGGQVRTQPDQAVLRVAVEASGPNASAVRQRLAANVSSMRSALLELGIDEGQVTTTDYDIRNQRRYGGPEDERPAVWGRHAFTITLTDLNRTGKVVVTAVENGATSVDDVRFTLSQAQRSELREEALSKAMDNARVRADVIAEGAGLTITGVGGVTTADVGYRPVRFETVAMAGGANVGTDIEGGAVTVTAQVTVTYNATEA